MLCAHTAITATTHTPSPDSPPRSPTSAPGSKHSPTESETTKNGSATSNAADHAAKPTDRPANEASLHPKPRLAGYSYDNALAETVIGLYKTELVRNRGPWRGLDDLELATLEWVDWFNHRRLLHHIGRIPPAEAEDLYYRQQPSGHHADTHTKQPA